MIARQWEPELAENGDQLAPTMPRLREQPSPIGQLLGQSALDEVVRSLHEDLALLQAEQEQGLGTVSLTLEQIGQDISAVRAQLSALAEPILAATAVSSSADHAAEHDRERAETQARFERLEKQVGILVRGLDSIDGLRYQSDVHTRALARLTDLLGEVVRPRPNEALQKVELAVAALELSQRQQARLQVIALSILGVCITPGIGALAWLVLRTGGF